MLIRVVPKMFFDLLEQGLDLFVDGLGFGVLHQDAALAVLGRDRAVLNVVASPEYAAKDRPEISIETDTIHDLHAELSARRPDLLHPNLPSVIERPWGGLSSRCWIAPGSASCSGNGRDATRPRGRLRSRYVRYPSDADPR